MLSIRNKKPVKKPNILIVEDEAVIAKDLQLSLENLGYIVPFTVSTGNEAIRKVRENNIDLVLMDIMLAGEVDGIETAHKIRTNHRIPVIYLTAYADKATLKRAKITEPYGYLIKPVSDTEMLSAIEMAIYKSNMERKLRKSEEKLIKHGEELEELIKERTSELIVANKLLQQEIAERKILEKAILETEERELQRIGYELHDGLGQLLSGLSLKSQSLENVLKNKSMPEAESAERITLLIDQAKENLRSLMSGNLPMETDQKNIMSLLEELAARTTRDFGLPCIFKFNRPVTIHSIQALTHLYRIAQEAVTNALKHAGPEHIEINLLNNNGIVKLTINDDGAGIANLNKPGNGLGLKIMNYRSNMIGASLDIRSEVNEGTSIRCTFTDKVSDKIDKKCQHERSGK